jgi:hypothetical protein
MAVPSGYNYRAGGLGLTSGYWKADGSGPYAITPAGAAVLLNLRPGADVVANLSQYQMLNGEYWKASDSSGPYSIRSA